MDIQQIIDILSNKIPFTDFSFLTVITAIIVLIVGYFVAIILSKYIIRIMTKAHIAQIITIFTAKVVKVFIIVFAIATILGMFGIDVGAAVISLSVVSGFIVGFAFQETLGNLAAGVMIIITKPFKENDFVKIGGNTGSVEQVGASTTTLVTYDNKKIIIPNSKVWGEPIINYTAFDTRLIDIEIGISYTDDMNKSVQTALNVLKNHSKILKKPDPVVQVKSLGDSSVNLMVRGWVNKDDFWSVKREIIHIIKETFDKEGITIPFKQVDVNFKNTYTKR